MATLQGWISLHRSITDHKLWQEKPFSWAQAWIDLLLIVNHRDSDIIFDASIIRVKRGQIITSVRKLAERWGWSRMKTSRFISVLESDHMVIKKCDTKKTVITICNYDHYQSYQEVDFDIEKPQKGHRKATEKPQTNTNNNDNNVNNINNNISLVQFSETINIPFSDFWNAYDKKAGNKEKLSRRWAKLSDADRQAIMDYIPLYIHAQPDKKFRKNPETFLNNKSWNDELIFSTHEPKQKSGTSRISRSLVEEVYSALPPELRPV